MDSNDFFGARFQTIFVEFLHLDAFALRFIDIFGLYESLLFQVYGLALQSFDLIDFLLDFSLLIGCKLCEIDFRVL